jgi:hypothetical protein
MIFLIGDALVAYDGNFSANAEWDIVGINEIEV